MKQFATYTFILIGSWQLHAQIPLGPVDSMPPTPPLFVSLFTQQDSANEIPVATLGNANETNIIFWPGSYPWYTDTNLVAMLHTTYTVIVTEPNPCVDSSLLHPVYGSSPLSVEFVMVPGAWSYSWGPAVYDPWQLSCWLLPPPDPYKGWHEINLFDSVQHITSSMGIHLAHAGELSSLPPPEKPEPAKPASVPQQPWYEAILPQPTRIVTRIVR